MTLALLRFQPSPARLNSLWHRSPAPRQPVLSTYRNTAPVGVRVRRGFPAQRLVQL